jgi:hypothetical protein
MFVIPYSGGKTEPIVGSCIAALVAEGLAIAPGTALSDAAGLKTPAGAAAGAAVEEPPVLRVTTKAHPSQPGGLTTEGIRTQLRDSLNAFQCSKVSDECCWCVGVSFFVDFFLAFCHNYKACT